ncbi:hypothetical protein [Lysobacter niastensis]|uniref:Uncharacterized protein n=1 Tax=Lysobacter niastensis TaxID=380629 RepID=A0ABS0BBU5_9GAMM|nr:hypothetical protein [Lysobacter niastensis]MBF6025221.1 hypothetical protein [Lysobacter niastensis]
MKLFAWKARHERTASTVLEDDLKVLEEMLESILDIVQPDEAMQHFAPHADVVRQRAGSFWPVAEDAIQAMLARRGVAR